MVFEQSPVPEEFKTKQNYGKFVKKEYGVAVNAAIKVASIAKSKNIFYLFLTLNWLKCLGWLLGSI